MSTRVGPVEAYLLSKIRQLKSIHLTLLDPEKTDPSEAAEIAREAQEAGTTAIMVGSSTLVETELVDQLVRSVKKAVQIPVIIFPNNVSAISRYADAIWFMSLLNSTDPYFIIGAQALASSLIKKYKLEAIPLGYIIVGDGGAAALVSQTRPLSYDHPELIALYASAAELLGMHFVYLEAGSGAKEPTPPDVVRRVKASINIPLIVGGGIKTAEDARRIAQAGADVVVTGTLVEEAKSVRSCLRGIVQAIHVRA